MSGGNKVSICTAWPSLRCRNGCIFDKYTRQPGCSKAGGKSTDAMHDLEFSRHKPSLNLASECISFYDQAKRVIQENVNKRRRYKTIKEKDFEKQTAIVKVPKVGYFTCKGYY